MKKSRAGRRQRRKAWQDLQRKQNADPVLDGDGLRPIIEEAADIRVLNELLAYKDWSIPEAATKRVPVELTRLALGLDKHMRPIAGEPDPAVQMKAASMLDRLTRTNLSKRVDAVRLLQAREAMSRGLVVNAESNIQVVVYIPERRDIHEYEVTDDGKPIERVTNESAIESPNGNGKA